MILVVYKNYLLISFIIILNKKI